VPVVATNNSRLRDDSITWLMFQVGPALLCLYGVCLRLLPCWVFRRQHQPYQQLSCMFT
jgi:hypothetical protein